jgi:hypothetical protein
VDLTGSSLQVYSGRRTGRRAFGYRFLRQAEINKQHKPGLRSFVHFSTSSGVGECIRQFFGVLEPLPPFFFFSDEKKPFSPPLEYLCQLFLLQLVYY